MNSFKQYLLTEKTFRLGQDVDMIFNLFFKDFIKRLRSGKWDGKFQKYKGISSGKLISKDAKAAHKLNPITITRDKTGNFYRPSAKRISLNVNLNALNIIRDHNRDFNQALDNVLPKYVKMIDDDISAEKVKASIYHELSHWIDDTLHNRYITKTLQKANSDMKHAGEIVNQGHSDVNFTTFEINAQIHALKQRKRTMSKLEWDELKFDDIMADITPFSNMRSSFKNSPKEYENWRKQILKRLARENLLGKRMKIRRKFR